MWYVYILICSDDTLYTGISNDPSKRLEEHRSGKGAKYTRGRSPLEMVYLSESGNRSEASKEEYRIKKLPREAKLLLLQSSNNIINNCNTKD